jgi:subtilisin family serine protease
MEIAHPDLIENVVADGSYDYVEADNDPTNPGIIGDHGTSVAGIIAARGWNNIGVRGVAPAASLKGFNFLRNQSLSNEIDALGGASNAPSGDVDIFNLSFGVNTTTAFRLNSSLEA